MASGAHEGIRGGIDLQRGCVVLGESFRGFLFPRQRCMVMLAVYAYAIIVISFIYAVHTAPVLMISAL